MHHHLAVPNKTEIFFRCACTKEKIFPAYLIGREPVSEVKRSGTELHCVPGVKMSNHKQIFVVLAQKKKYFRLI